MEQLEKDFKNLTITQFLERLDNTHASWLVKRLSGNDTGITGGHQAGLYIPRSFMQEVVPNIVTTEQYNPTKAINCFISSHDCYKEGIQAKYYNNKYFPEKKLLKKYDEFRLTRWKDTPLQDVDNTGAICILASIKIEGNNHLICWVSRNAEEEDDIEQWLGQEIEPGRMYYSKQLSPFAPSKTLEEQIPEQWKHSFPTSREIFDFVAKLLPEQTWSKTPDELLLKRRGMEFEVFSIIEHYDVLPNIQNGYQNVDDFIKYANTVVNRRKSRSGTSLELNLASIFTYHQVLFETQVVTEQNKKPDFVFPSADAYRNHQFPEYKLSMLASKTCCKDRWRQILNEADRIHPKHLFTLQEGISTKQLSEMKANGVVLVVPEPNRHLFPTDDDSLLMNLTSFIDLVLHKQSSH